MLDPRLLVEMISRSTQEECRELGKLFLSMADAPRDVHWRAGFAEKLATLPEPPETTLAGVIAAARARVTAEHDEQWAQGWHPQQMRAELEARGYTGAVTTVEVVQ